MTNIIINAYNALGGPAMDYRVVAGTLALLIVVGMGTAVVTHIVKKRKAK